MSQLLLARYAAVDLSQCHLEPIQIPSLIQPHGMLLAARGGDLRLVYASENASVFLGVTAAFLLGKTLPEVLGPEAMASIEEALGEQVNVPKNLRTMSFPRFPGRWFNVTAHRSAGLVCAELEVASGEARWDSLAARLKGATSELDEFSTVSELCAAIPRVLRRLTGYDRVIVYRFQPDGHGEVVGEDKLAEMSPFLGLHYPATDIPEQARALYLRQRLRTIVDVDAVPVAVLGDREMSGDQALDMTFCNLRSSSPNHLEYMRIMGVNASLGISLVLSGELWGLVVGHHRTSKRLTPETRALCALLGEFVSLLLGTAVSNDAAADRREKEVLLDLLGTSLEEDTQDDLFANQAQALLTLVRADGVVARRGGRTTLLGQTPALEDCAALFGVLQARLQEEPLSTDRVGTLLPGFADLASQASGALFIPFQEPADGLLWLRKEEVQTVRWAGPPDGLKMAPHVSIRRSPRRSFAVQEQVQYGRSPAWLPAEIEAALRVQRLVFRASRLRNRVKQAHLRTDALTGLGNRLELRERKARWRARGPQRPGALLFLDLDAFRAINDRCGHTVGDEFLRQVGARLADIAKARHFVARLGGDEFAIFCENTSLWEAEQLCGVILGALAEPFQVMGLTLSSTASIGIAPVSPIFDSKSLDPLRVADSAMYVAKHKGGNQFSIVESREQAEILRATIVEEETARRLAALELSTSHARFHSVLDSTSDNVVTIGHDWTMLYANQRAAANLPEFRIGDNYWRCFPSVVGTSAERALRAAMTERTDQSYESFFAPYRRWFSARAFPVAEGISVFFSDITAEKSNRDQLALEQLLREKRIEALTHMAAGLAHEISNPLAIIHGVASDLSELARSPAPVDAGEVSVACANILKTAKRAGNILHGLRGFAREAAQDPMELGSIYEIVDQCLQMKQASLERHGIGVRLRMDTGIPRFLCREVQVGQIVSNLLNNAVDAISQADVPEHWIGLSVSALENQVRVEVSDSGPGIEDHFRAHLMEPFFTTKELGLGMGVGLSLSRAIAQDHGGTLTLLSETEHTTFRLTLPLTLTLPAPPLLPVEVLV